MQSATHIDTLTATGTHRVSDTLTAVFTVTGSATVTETCIAIVIVIVGVIDTLSDLLIVVFIDVATLIYYCY